MYRIRWNVLADVLVRGTPPYSLLLLPQRSAGIDQIMVHAIESVGNHGAFNPMQVYSLNEKQELHSVI